MNSLEVLWRTGSWSLAFRRGRRHYSGREQTFSYRGHTVRYREGASDAGDAVELLFSGDQCPYHIPFTFQPRVAWDIGASIGLASIYLHVAYPGLTIHAFEPVAANFRLLQANTASLANIHTYHAGLGANTTQATITASAAHSPNSFSTFRTPASDAAGARPDPNATKPDAAGLSESIDLWSPQTALERTGGAAPDLIKIDAEGAEYDVLTAMPEPVLSDVKVIVGELHDRKDYALLDHLEQWFVIAAGEKTLSRRKTHFLAVNRKQGDLFAGVRRSHTARPIRH